MESNKIIGYVLLTIGIVIIFWTLFQSYNIFIGNVSAPLVFKIPANQNNSNSDSSLNMEQQLKVMLGNKIQEALPVETIPKVLNLLSWLIFTTILIFGGGQIAKLGIKMIK